ncbi:hypothetical protein GCM10023085_50210 [Actinomadura viridis]
MQSVRDSSHHNISQSTLATLTAALGVLSGWPPGPGTPRNGADYKLLQATAGSAAENLCMAEGMDTLGYGCTKELMSRSQLRPGESVGAIEGAGMAA